MSKTHIRNLIPAIQELVNDNAIAVTINYQPKFRPNVPPHVIVQARLEGRQAFVPVFYDDNQDVETSTIPSFVESLTTLLTA